MSSYPDRLQQSELISSLSDFENHEEGFRSIAEFAPVMLWMSDAEGKSQFMNKKYLQFIGANESSELGMLWMDALHPADRKNCLTSFQNAFSAKMPFQIEYQMRRYDGKYRWILDSGEPVYAEDGSFSGYIGSSQDITDRIQALKALQSSFAELKRNNEENTLLAAMNSYLQVCHNTEELYPVINYYAKQLFPELSGLVSLINDSRTLVEAIVEWGNPEISAKLFNLEECWSLRQGKIHSVENPRHGLLCQHVKAEATPPYLCVPMNAYGETLGMVHLQRLKGAANEHDASNELDNLKTLVSNFANQTALAIANLKLREALQHQSVRDPLTQLHNRRYLIESLNRELAYAKRNQISVGIVMIDVDHFKRYNDTYGHDAGDMLLCNFAKLLVNLCRRDDIVCRYGGEEFVMVMRDISEEALLNHCNYIREKSKQLDLEFRGQNLGGITVSMGVSLYPEYGETPDNLINAADAALYIAKDNGRDQVVLAPKT